MQVILHCRGLVLHKVRTRLYSQYVAPNSHSLFCCSAWGPLYALIIQQLGPARLFVMLHGFVLYLVLGVSRSKYRPGSSSHCFFGARVVCFVEHTVTRRSIFEWMTGGFLVQSRRKLGGHGACVLLNIV